MIPLTVISYSSSIAHLKWNVGIVKFAMTTIHYTVLKDVDFLPGRKFYITIL